MLDYMHFLAEKKKFISNIYWLLSYLFGRVSQNCLLCYSPQ